MAIALYGPFYRKCKYCGSEFETNHGNRYFCLSPTREERQDGIRDCKVTYNNLEAKRLRDLVKGTNHQTLKNLKILEWFFSRGMFTVTGDQLLFKGFDPSRSTGRAKNSSGEYTVPEYYHFKLINQGNNTFLIQKI